MHAMIDIETIGREPDAIILSIGAVIFDPHGEEVELTNDKAYHSILKLDEQKNRTTSIQSIRFWAQQEEDTAHCFFAEEETRESVDAALKRMFMFFWTFKYEDVDVFWFHGPQFDQVKLETLLKENNFPYPWEYYQVRDSRTLFSLMPEDPREFPDEFVSHNAMHDAAVQARGVQKAYKYLNL